MVKLVVGLGNPGNKYAKTRHNLGFWVLDRMAEQDGFRFDKRQFKAETADTRQGAERVIWVKPQTFMNLSGPAARDIAGFFKIEPESILVVYDDVDLKPGTIRLRSKGGSGGHRGVASIISALGTNEFPRVRIGIGSGPPEIDTADYVLMKPSSEERETLESACERAGQAVRCWLEHGIERAMQESNAPTDLPE